MKKKLLIALCAFGAVTVIVGAAALAATSYGGSSDPLVTLSYINDVVKPELLSKFDSQLDAKITELKGELDKKVAALESQYGSAAELAERSTYKVVTLENGQKLTGSVGTELLLRIGSASVYTTYTPGLIDTTMGSELNSGESLVKNHLYMVTIDGRTIKATAHTMIVVRGDYTIS